MLERPDSIDKRILFQLQPPYHEYAQAFLQYFLKGFHAVDRTHKSSSPPPPPMAVLNVCLIHRVLFSNQNSMQRMVKATDPSQCTLPQIYGQMLCYRVDSRTPERCVIIFLRCNRDGSGCALVYFRHEEMTVSKIPFISISPINSL